MNTTILHAEVLHAEVEFLAQTLSPPMQISKGLITEITEARATVRVRAGEREAVGRGSIYLSDLWAWPEPSLTHEQRDQVLRRLCRHIAENLSQAVGEPAHPLELGLRLYERVAHQAPSGFEPVSILARAMCLSPFDAAIHDAVGRALGCSAFDLFSHPTPIPSADALFPGQGAIAAIRQTLRRPSQTHFPAWLIVGKNDDLEPVMASWVRQRGYHCFKLKIGGRDNPQDVERTAQVYQAARHAGVAQPQLSIDSNEANPDADSVLDYLRQLREKDAEAFAAIMYLEQPTGRDIFQHRYDWRAVAKLKPVLLDEGLTGFDVLAEAKAQGWSGLALKTCKGHSFALIAAAWARDNGLLVSLQDLTNPGYAAIHAALFAAHVPTINGVELNSPQFTPAANAPWLPRLAGLLNPQDGTHHLPAAAPIGLGSEL
jgi:L-alanine-DL-glutamate epimerase-like enolase superfamily enzyme